MNRRDFLRSAGIIYTGLVVTSRDRLFAQPTDDAGAKLWPRYDVHFAGTGDDIFISPHHDSWRSRPPTGAIHAPVKVISTQLPPQADAVQWIQQATGLSEVRLAELLGVGRLTVRHWKAGNPIKQEASLRRLLETKDVLRRAQRWHPRPEELVTWLHTPDPDAGISPARLLAHGEFDRARLLAVLEPSAVEPTPAWAKRPVPAAWQEALVLRHA